ncbi:MULTISPECIES: hypothetical protein [unclassified Stenotrophomonas]|uniref:hypothetical protein n=1 Tax=unclassified Stenotrophomonas TaxID=196198 RepID=UPI0021197763|nr:MULTISPECIES: hypothetical protein [unclassified Stenotrophomonas]
MTAHAHVLPSPIERFDLQSQIVLQGDPAARATLSAREGFEFPDLAGSRQSIAWLLQNELSVRVAVEGADPGTGGVGVEQAVAAVMARLGRTRCVADHYQPSEDPDDYRNADDQVGALDFTCHLPDPAPLRQHYAELREAATPLERQQRSHRLLLAYVEHLRSAPDRPVRGHHATWSRPWTADHAVMQSMAVMDTILPELFPFDGWDQDED